MTIEYDITPEEYAKFSVHTHRNDDRQKKSLNRLRFITGPIMILVGACFILISKESPSIVAGLFLVVMGGYYLVCSPKRHFQHMLNKVMELINTKKDEFRIFLMHRRMEFTESCIRSTNDYESAETSWDALIWIHETPEFFFMYNSRISAFIIPKRVFQDNHEEEFRALLNDRHLTVTYFQQ